MASAAPLILLAEPHPPSADLIVTLLEDLGLKAVVLTRGDALLEALLSRQGHVVLLSIDLPDMDGFRATRQIRDLERRRLIPPVVIIGLTPQGLIDERQLCLDAGMDGHLSKPVTLGRLSAALSPYPLPN
ncbi:response regulator [Asticcacaulis sp. W401b]|jgi:CheY-like chemotaxis protein|uniref:response regulator n=2 Tax=unclassified Asticcacaulis TaxID=2628350 RepID=UPI003970B619